MRAIKFETDVMSPYIKFDAYQFFMNEHVEVFVKLMNQSVGDRAPLPVNFKDYLRAIPKLDEPLNLSRCDEELVLRDVFA
jgi:hypothetical protein